MKKQSLKKDLIRIYAEASILRSFGDENGEWMGTLDVNLILVTPFGLIEGTLLVKQDHLPREKSLALTLGEQVISEFEKEETPLSENDGFLTLADVKVYTSGNESPITMPVLNVFYDSIIGVTCGEIGPNR